jgi:Fe/S biogenesis protein NfuA
MQAPRLAISEFARTRIEQVRASQRQPQAGVRVAIVGRQGAAFQYDMQLVSPGGEQPGDLLVDAAEGIFVYVPLSSAPYLDNATIDADPLSGALRVVNPNPLWFDPLAEQIQAFLDGEINPMVAAHGGHIDLLDVAGGVAYIHMGGACQGCGMADVTLGQGVRVALLDSFDELSEVRDTTDHAAGTNPYYEASKK